MTLISVVIPMFNEQACLQPMYDRLKSMAAGAGEQFEFIFVDDGSGDSTLAMLRQLAAADPSVKYVSFSRNFGHEAAIIAGLDHADGEAVVTLDGDLQHPPEVIPEMIRKWREGYHVVYAQRRAAGHESVLKKIASQSFYRVFRRVSDVNMPLDSANFRLLDRRVVQQVRRLREQARFIRGLVCWVGFRQTGIPYDEGQRAAGETKYSMAKSARLAVDAMMSFANLPFRKVAAVGAVVSAGAMLVAAVLLLKSMVLWQGAPSGCLVACGLFFLGGVQLLVLGMVGEYVVRGYRQMQNRPLYIVGEKSPALPPGDEGLAGR